MTHHRVHGTLHTQDNVSPFSISVYSFTYFIPTHFLGYWLIIGVGTWLGGLVKSLTPPFLTPGAAALPPHFSTCMQTAFQPAAALITHLRTPALSLFHYDL